MQDQIVRTCGGCPCRDSESGWCCHLAQTFPPQHPACRYGEEKQRSEKCEKK